MLFQKKKSALLAVANGNAIPLVEVPDEAFSTGILGKGFAVDPTDGTVYSPISGRVDNVSDSKHAYTIFSDDGLDLLVHIGIDSVTLKGNGFIPMVESGALVRAGDPLAKVDLDLLRAKGIPTLIPVLVTNPERLRDTDFTFGAVEAGKSTVMQYRLS